MHTTIGERLIQKARITASAFVEEFGEPLDPATTDWDTEAWTEDRKGLGLEDADKETYVEGWELYQETLINETKRLCS